MPRYKSNKYYRFKGKYPLSARLKLRKVYRNKRMRAYLKSRKYYKKRSNRVQRGMRFGKNKLPKDLIRAVYRYLRK